MKAKDTVIILDNGHGIETFGKRSPKFDGKQLLEYEFNRDVVARIQEGLYEYPVLPIVLVPEETDVSLRERIRRANVYKHMNPLLISVHANAHGDGSKFTTANGWEAFTNTGFTESDVLCEFLYAAAEKTFNGRFRLREGGIYENSRGKEAEFAIIRNSPFPTVLTENLFMTNKTECEYILSNEGRETIAQLHIDGIIEYLKYKGKLK